MKKHIQSLHPEVYKQIIDSKDLEKYCKIIKGEPAEKSSPKQIPINEKLQPKPEIKEEIKQTLETVPKEEMIKPPEEVGTNPLVSAYYPPMQSELLPLPYGNPFLYGRQNYGLFCMVPPSTQNEPARQQDFWMKRFALADKQTWPLMPQPTELPNTIEPQKAKIQNLEEEDKDFLARSLILPHYPTTPLPQSEHNHIHCEFCGHSTIRHNGHTDFIHNAELHYVNAEGKGLLEY